MKRRWRVELGGLAAAGWLLVLGGALPGAAAAQGFDPASTIGAYTAALNNHDVSAALALFDANGSATDLSGRTYEGRAGLTEFLLGSGFANPKARITTDHLRVVGNRALWTYSCSCAAGLTNVRVVVNGDKITVFYIRALPDETDAVGSTGLAANRTAPPRAWLAPLAGLGLGLIVAAVVFGVRRRRLPDLPTRPSQGTLLVGLAQSRGLLAHGVDRQRRTRTNAGFFPWR